MAKPQTESRAIIVLGMHRGGTSSATRGLQCLGVELGDDLLASAAAENPRGFFEDVPLLELSDRVFDGLGLGWDSTSLIGPDVWQRADLAGLELEAAQSIRSRFAGLPIWGFKNPRSARLLPFWQRVLARTGRKEAYVLVVRNPLSVAQSIEVRNGFLPAKSYLLWLIHMTEAVLQTRGKPRVCVDYDRLLADPARELGRISSALALPAPETNPEALRAYAEDFLADEHRNSHFEAQDVELDADLSLLARRAYSLLDGWARDKEFPSSSQLQRAFLQISERLQELAPVFAHVADLDSRVKELEPWAKIGETSAEELERRARLLQERDAELGNLRGELEQQREVLEIWEVDLASARSELGATRAGLSAAQSEAGSFQTELEAHQQEITGLQENLRSETADKSGIVIAHEAELRRIGEEHNRETGRREAQRLELEDSLRVQLSEVEAEKGRLEVEVTVQRHEIETRRAEIETRRHEIETHRLEIETHRNEMIDWLHGQTTASASRLLDACQILRVSTTWKWVSRIQRAAARIRLRNWSDGSLHLYQLINELHTQSQRNYIVAASLSEIAIDIRRVLDQVVDGRIFRTLRRVISLGYRLRFKSMTAGPVELLHSHVREIAFFLAELSHAPFESGVAPPLADEVVVGRCVDVIIPVHGAREQTLRCIESVLRSTNQTPFELIVIDDASRDRKLQRSLDELFQQGVITLLRNEENLGFPRTANRGMLLHIDRDLVLLNSDTVVHGDWLDRLRRSALSDWNVATVTPFSNNGEICSYPTICQPETMPDEEQLAELDNLAARTNSGLSITLPTAVGFCTYIRRHVLSQIGYFDEERFLRGYGEENEFCLRASSRGYRNLLAADVFVAHEGGSSFLEHKEELIRQGLEQLNELHPEYEADVHRFISSDPIRWFRQRLDVARLANDGRKAVLMVNHALGGGTERHVRELAGHLEAEGASVWLLQPDSSTHVSLFRSDLDRSASRNLVFDLPADFGRLVEVLEVIPVRHVHFHHLLGIDPIIRELPAALGVRYDVSVHDYFTICPRINLVDDRDSYCGVPDAESCTACVRRNGSHAGFEVDVAQWRSDSATLLSNSRRVYAPSQDVLSRLDSLVPGVNWRLRPHPEEYPEARSVAASRATDEPLRVAVIGAIGFHKGSRVLLDCANDAAKRDLPLQFHVIGYTDVDRELVTTGKVSIGGTYRDEELQEQLALAGCQIALLPSVWPETFCYTLSAALAGKLYPVAFDLGAIAERIRALGWGELLSIRTSAAELNDHLLDLEPPLFPTGSSWQNLETSYKSYLVDYYDSLEL